MRILLILLAFVGSNVVAQEIYKSVDEDGNVSYSGLPPVEGENVKTLEAVPEPSSHDVEAAQERVQNLEKTTKMLEQEDVQNTSQQQTNTDNVTIEANSGVVPVGAPAIRRSNHGPVAHRGRRR